MRRGDIIFWMFKSHVEPISEVDTMWSSIEMRYVPVGGLCLLVDLSSTKMSWLSRGMLCTARRSDCSLRFNDDFAGECVIEPCVLLETGDVATG